MILQLPVELESKTFPHRALCLYIHSDAYRVSDRLLTLCNSLVSISFLNADIFTFVRLVHTIARQNKLVVHFWPIGAKARRKSIVENHLLEN